MFVAHEVDPGARAVGVHQVVAGGEADRRYRRGRRAAPPDSASVRCTSSRHRSVSRYRQAASPDVVIFCCSSASLSARANRVAASACSRSSSYRARTVAG